ncbi:inositol monophosphatase family protein [Spirulina sp. CS-785/01]|uniref:inositol monophosphatase family protein n=1 Tax=Spirulina sp. CS-785/01 TaxID=3021716 RepID=UPI00232D6753|nr:inositol monophosphatase family protein [Spirulina sp. CS-785/01]MDB9315139.1 inositol monophosphatase family protein [Spirulina sp. CS-785/01]
MTSVDQLHNFLDIATQAVLEAGAVLKTHQGKIKTIQEKGRPGDLVTEVDKKSEDALLSVLKRHLPDHAILAEESGQHKGKDSDYLWAIDPLDGTTNYAHGYPAYCVSAGLLVEGKPVLGVIYDPSLDELYRAAQGLGATCNYQPIQVSTTASLQQSLLVTGFAYDRRETSDNNYAEFCYLTHLTQGVRRGGSAALDLVSVAMGRLDGYWERGIKPWDVAAGTIIVEEAGGRISAYDGSPLDLQSGRILATNGLLHDSLSQTLSQTPPLESWAN